MSPRAPRRSKPMAGLSHRSGFGKDLLTISAIPRDEIHALLRSAQDLKRTRARGLPHQHLPGLTLGLLFEKPSTRTRVSFEAGMNQLGGQAARPKLNCLIGPDLGKICSPFQPSPETRSMPYCGPRRTSNELGRAAYPTSIYRGSPSGFSSRSLRREPASPLRPA